MFPNCFPCVFSFPFDTLVKVHVTNFSTCCCRLISRSQRGIAQHHCVPPGKRRGIALYTLPASCVRLVNENIHYGSGHFHNRLAHSGDAQECVAVDWVVVRSAPCDRPLGYRSVHGRLDLATPISVCSISNRVCMHTSPFESICASSCCTYVRQINNGSSSVPRPEYGYAVSRCIALLSDSASGK